MQAAACSRLPWTSTSSRPPRPTSSASSSARRARRARLPTRRPTAQLLLLGLAHACRQQPRLWLLVTATRISPPAQGTRARTKVERERRTRGTGQATRARVRITYRITRKRARPREGLVSRHAHRAGWASAGGASPLARRVRRHLQELGRVHRGGALATRRGHRAHPRRPRWGARGETGRLKR